MKIEKDIPFNNLLKISVVKRQLEYTASMLNKKLIQSYKTRASLNFLLFFQVHSDYPSCMLWLTVKDAISLDESLTDKTNTTANSIARWNIGTMSS